MITAVTGYTVVSSMGDVTVDWGTTSVVSVNGR